MHRRHRKPTRNSPRPDAPPRLALVGAALFALLGLALAGPALAGPIIGEDDGDGVPQAIDNCTEIANASQCDTDNDGYGNVCDADFNQDLVVSATDITGFMAPDFLAGTDSGVGTDMNCDGTVSATDITDFLAPQFTQGTPGPSGLLCAGTTPCP